MAGPDRAGNLLELVVVAVDTGAMVIHAMTLRRTTSVALFGNEEQ